MNNLCDLHLMRGIQKAATLRTQFKNSKGEDYFAETCDECVFATEIAIHLMFPLIDGGVK